MTQPLDSLGPLFGQEAQLERDLPAVSATGTYVLGVFSLTRAFRVQRVEVIVDATYAANPSAFYVLALVHGAGVVNAAQWSTQSTAQGAITGGTPAVMVPNGTDANSVIPGGDVVSIVCTKNSTAANITPRVVVHGHFVSSGT